MDDWRDGPNDALIEKVEGLLAEVERLRAFLPRLDSYFGNGGLFNPEMMEHEKVRDLLRDLRAALRGGGE